MYMYVYIRRCVCAREGLTDSLVVGQSVEDNLLCFAADLMLPPLHVRDGVGPSPHIDSHHVHHKAWEGGGEREKEREREEGREEQDETAQRVALIYVIKTLYATRNHQAGTHEEKLGNIFREP